MMDGSENFVQPNAATIQLESISPYTSFARVIITVSKETKVRIMTIEKSSLLRTPTPAEFAKIDTYVTVESRNKNTWWDLTDSTNYLRMLGDAEPIEVFEDVQNEGACRRKCDEISTCRRITFTWLRVCLLYAIGISTSVEFVSLPVALTQHLGKKEQYTQEAANAFTTVMGVPEPAVPGPTPEQQAEIDAIVAKFTKLASMYALATQVITDAVAQLEAEAAAESRAATQSPRHLNGAWSWSAGRAKAGDVEARRRRIRQVAPAQASVKAGRILAGSAAQDPYVPAVAFMHMGATFEVQLIALQAGDRGLFAGTTYTMFLSAEGSSWDQIAASRTEFTTTGCSITVCRMTAWPEVRRLGGFSDRRSITMYMSLNRRGSVWCLPFPASRTDPPSVSSVMLRGDQFSLADIPSNEDAKTIFTYTFKGLMLKATYFIYCATKSPGANGSLITQGSMELTRVTVRTAEYPLIIYALENMEQVTVDDDVHISVDVILSAEGLLYCTAQEPFTTLNSGVPRGLVIESQGEVISAEQGTVTVEIVRPRMDAPYEVYCTAKSTGEDEEEGMTKLITVQMVSYPQLYVVSASVDYSKISLVFMLDRKATVRCLPVEASLTPPTITQVVASPWNEQIDIIGGGRMRFMVRDLSPGTNFVLYCHTEQLTTELVKYGMTHEQMLEAAFSFRTIGPDGSNYVITCDVGSSCHANLSGEGLSWGDRIWASPKPCRRNCKCAAIMDPINKGSTCSNVSQEPSVPGVGPFPEDKEEDPGGAWCYVDPLDECTDTRQSAFFSHLYVSYLACESGALRALPGFPNGGLSLALNGGYYHTWGTQRVNSTATMLHLCWCSGTMECTGAQHFVLTLGVLLLRGPSMMEVLSDHVCQFGTSCTIPFHGLAVPPVSTLIAILPTARRTCYRDQGNVSRTHDPGLLLPNGGMAEPTATEEVAKAELSLALRHVPFRFGDLGEVAVIDVGTYQLCFCAECTSRTVGATHLATAGYLHLAGPKLHQKFTCSVGKMCDIFLEGAFAKIMIEQVFIIAADRCGIAPVAPFGWFTTNGALEDSNGLTVGQGWLNNNTGLAHLNALYDPWVPQLGAYGFAHGGMANVSRNQRSGQLDVRVRWAHPIIAIAGTYQLCWRVAHSTPDVADITQFYHFGELAVAGAVLFPHRGYVFECARAAPCTITNLKSYKAFHSRVLIVRGTCGSHNQLMPSFPNKGLSLPSHDGNTFSFGSDLVRVEGGTYSICWCRAECADDVSQFLSFAGTLRIAAPLFTWRLVVLAVPAENASAALARFAAILRWTDPRADTTNVAKSGSTLYTVPYIEMRGRSTYAAEIQLPSLRDAEHVVNVWQEAGEQLVRPLATVVPKYHCAQNEPCGIYGFAGSYLSDMNRVMVAHTCGESSGVGGFATRGLSSNTLRNGTAFQWEGNITAAAGHYQLCWCWRDCRKPTDFKIDVGMLIVVGPSTTEEHVCYDRAPRRCAFTLADRGLDGGDRVVALPIEVDCYANGDNAITAAYTGLSDFPRSGYSLPIDGSLLIDFGPGEIHMKPQMLRLCWCRSAQHNCTENALRNFVLAGGVLRVASLEEYYKTYKPDFVYDTFDVHIFVFLACPLPVFCCLAIFARRKQKRLRVHERKAEVEAKRVEDERKAREVLSTPRAKSEAVQELFDRRFNFRQASGAPKRMERPGSAPLGPLAKLTHSLRAMRPDTAPMSRWRMKADTLPTAFVKEHDDELLDRDDESIINVDDEEIDDIPFAPSSLHAPYNPLELPRKVSRSAVPDSSSRTPLAIPEPPPLPNILVPRISAIPRFSAPPTFNIGGDIVPLRPTALLPPREHVFSSSPDDEVSPKALLMQLRPIGQRAHMARWTALSVPYTGAEHEELRGAGNAAAEETLTDNCFLATRILRDID
eukprot:GEMP01000494.1.p1 GENE.GEMP01000494.1~~GEMP01000494.1.p1  ORF type:complete len:2104 (+),score=473.63 GEMP01000494.1:631-6312(+)